MPGKVNPVHCEMLVMVAAQVMGHDVAIAHCGAGGQLQLNAMLPLMAQDLLRSIELLASGSRTFADRCVAGLQANTERCAATLERNLSLATALAPAIGYDKAAEIAKEAHEEGLGVAQVAAERSGLDAAELARLMDPAAMAGPTA